MDISQHYSGGRGGDKHETLILNNIRCIKCGPNNSGKTYIMFNLLLHPNGLRFKNVSVFSKSLYQTKYRLFENVKNRQSDEEIGYRVFSEKTTQYTNIVRYRQILRRGRFLLVSDV